MKTLYALSLASVIGIAGVSFAASPTFEDLDKDRNGVLSKAEAVSAGLDFAKADTNKDGALDRAEYQAAIS